MCPSSTPTAVAPAETDVQRPSAPSVFLGILSSSLRSLQTSVTQKENRFTLRALHHFPKLRHNFQPHVYREAMSALLLHSYNASSFYTVTKRPTASNLQQADSYKEQPNGKASKKSVEINLFNPNLIFVYKILSMLPAQPSDATELKEEDISKEINTLKEKFPEGFFDACLPEVEVFLSLLALVYWMGQKQYGEAQPVADLLIDRVKQYNRRTLDVLNAKAYFYYSWAYELSGRLSDIRQELLTAYRKACVHGDMYSQATLLNLLLRNYLHYDLYGLAVKLVNKTVFVENFRSNTQYARYLYYLGRIQAVQLHYHDAYNKLVQAGRKAPQGAKVARGFRLAATKMSIVVDLLMGDIPDRSTFNVKDLRQELQPYMSIVMAVRSGDLHAFSSVVEKYENQFAHDGTLFLIKRLHNSVIRAGLRMLNLSYSRIALSDIALKLGLDATEDTDSIVSKAILDGVVEAVIHSDEKYVEFKSKTDVYGTSEPMKAFNKRIAFCLQLHSDAVKAMRYPESDKDKMTKAEARQLTQELRVEEEAIGDDLEFI